MARQFDTEVEARLSGKKELKLKQLNNEKVTSLSQFVCRNSDGKYEWYVEAYTDCARYICSEDGEILDRIENEEESVI